MTDRAHPPTPSAINASQGEVLDRVSSVLGSADLVDAVREMEASISRAALLRHRLLLSEFEDEEP